MGLSIWQILIVVLVIILLFGSNKISSLAGDLAKGIKTFKKGMSDEGDKDTGAEHPKEIDVTPQVKAETSQETSKQEKTGQP